MGICLFLDFGCLILDFIHSQRLHKQIKKIMKKLYILISILIITHSDCNQSPQQNNKDAAEAIYFGGDIITMEGDSLSYYRSIEAVALKNGKIIFTGKKADFVLLEENPFKVDPLKIKDIKILATVFEGRMFAM